MTASKPWPLVAVPHDDVKSGRFDLAQFAANLGAVDANSPGCPSVYVDPVAFFRATWRTSALADLLGHVSGVLAGGSGDRVLQLRTPFGGGKTHTLIALLHLLRSRRALAEAGLLDSAWPDPGEVTVVVLPCLELDPAAGRLVAPGVRLHTLWGELAWRLAGIDGYQLVAAADQARVQPGAEAIRALFAGRRALVLLDEVLTYVEGALGVVVGESTLGRQTLAFLQHLTEVVAGQPNAAVVYSLQKSIGQAFGNEDLLTMLDNLVSRVDAKREPVSGDDVLRVVQRRLFSDLGNLAVREAVASQVSSAWLRARLAQPLSESERRNTAEQGERLRTRILDAYPFHPELLDLMYHRWGALPSYQRTRGALQFLAATVHALHQRGAGAGLLIGPGDVPLEVDAVRHGLFSQVAAGNDWTAVLAADVTGASARCKVVDREVTADSATLGVQQPGSRLAQALVLYSFGGRQGEERGVLRDELLDAVQTPDAPRDVLEGPLQRLCDSLLYLHTVGRHLRFDKKPNLNKLVDDAAKALTGDEVVALMRKTLEPILGERSAFNLWPSHHSEVTDRQARFVVVFWPIKMALEDPETHARTARNWTEHCGPTRRSYRNALCFAVPAARAADDARTSARRVLACRELIAERRRFALSDEDAQELRERESRATAELLGSLRGLYSHVLIPVAAPPEDADPIRIERLDIPVHHNTGSQLVEAARKAVERLVTANCTASRLADRLHLGAGPAFDKTHWISGPELVDHVFGNVAFPKLFTIQGLQQSVARGVGDGRLGWVEAGTATAAGLKVGAAQDIQLAMVVDVQDVDLAEGSFVVSPEYAKALADQLRPAPAKPTADATPPVSRDGTSQPAVPTGDGGPIASPSRAESVKVTAASKSGRREVQLKFTAKGPNVFAAMGALADLQNWARADFTVEVICTAKGTSDLDEHMYTNRVRGAIDEVASIHEG